MVANTSAHNRRGLCFAFSLRTLFVVVTVFGLWLGYQLHWIRQRHELLGTRGVCHSDQPLNQNWCCVVVFPPRKPPPPAPGLLGIFGETGITSVEVPIEKSRFRDFTDPANPEWRRAQRLFPEAEVEVYPLIVE